MFIFENQNQFRGFLLVFCSSRYSFKMVEVFFGAADSMEEKMGVG